MAKQLECLPDTLLYAQTLIFLTCTLLMALWDIGRISVFISGAAGKPLRYLKVGKKGLSDLHF